MKNFRQGILRGLFAGLFMLLWQFSFGQIIYTSTPDSIAYLNEQYNYQVTTYHSPDAPTYALLTAPAGMTINDTSGLITWTPTSIASGGKVVIQATNSYGSLSQTYNIYISNAVVCDTSLVSYWPMDYLNNHMLPDWANGHDANWSGPSQPEPTISSDAMAGNSVLFAPTNGDDELYTVADTAPFQVAPGGEFSVSFWFKNQTPTIAPFREVMIGKYTSGGSMWYVAFDPRDSLVSFYIRDNGSDDTTVVSNKITDHNWHHVVATFHSYTGSAYSYLFLYVDKVQKMVKHDFYTDDFRGTGDLDIGWYSQGGQAYTGYLDEVAYYKSELSQAEVDTLYNKGMNGESICSPGNIAPLILSSPDTTSTQGIAYSYTMKYSELDGGDVDTILALVKPSWLSLNPSTGVLSGTPGNSNVGDTTVTLGVSDGTDTISQTFNIHVANVNDAPVLSGIESSAVGYTEGDPATVITSSIIPTDIDNANLQSAWVSISKNYLSTEDTLEFTNMGNITGSFNQSSGVLTLTGSDTKANYQTALRSVKYLNKNNAKPSVLTRTVSFTVSDGSLNSDTLTRDITVTGVNDPPVVNSQNAVSTNEDVSVTIGFSDLNVTDVDNVYPTDFTLTVLNGSNYTHTGNTITPAANWNGTLTVPYNLSDGTNTVSGTLNVTVIPVNDPPVITTTPVTDAYAQQAYLYLIKASDVDAGDILTDTIVKAPSWLTLIAQGGDYALTGTPGYSDVGADSVVVAVHDSSYAYDYQRFVLTIHNKNHIPQFTSTPVTAVDQDVQYMYNIAVTDSDAADIPNLTVTAVQIPSWLTLSANGSVLSGTPTNDQVGMKPDSTYHVELSVSDQKQSSTQSFDIVVTNINDAPVLSGIESSAVTYTEGDPATSITSALMVADVDNANMNSAVVSITGNYNASEDTLEFADMGNITGTFSQSTGVLTLSGSDTKANYQTALRSIKYYNKNNDNPSTLTRTVSFTVNDGALNSNTLTRDITVTGVDNAPVLSGIESSAISYTEGDPATSITSALMVTDVDNTNINSAEVSITGDYNASEDTLEFADMGNITGTFSQSTGVLSLSGSDTKANYQTALRSVKYYNKNNNNPSTLTRTVSFTVNDGALNSNTLTRDITVTGVDDAPVIESQLTSVTSYADSSFTISLSDLKVTDVDNPSSDFSLIIASGNGYTVSGNKVTVNSDAPTGTLTVNVKVSDGTLESAVFSFEVTINKVTTGIQEVAFDNHLISNLYPNPASSDVTLKLNTSEPVTIQITDISGKVVFQNVYRDYNKSIHIDVSGFAGGLYRYKIMTNKAYQFGNLLIQR